MIWESVGSTVPPPHLKSKAPFYSSKAWKVGCDPTPTLSSYPEIFRKLLCSLCLGRVTGWQSLWASRLLPSSESIARLPDLNSDTNRGGIGWEGRGGWFLQCRDADSGEGQGWQHLAFFTWNPQAPRLMPGFQNAIPARDHVHLCRIWDRNSKEMKLETRGLYHVNNTERKPPLAAGSKDILTKEGVLAQTPVTQLGHFRLQIEIIKPDYVY